MFRFLNRRFLPVLLASTLFACNDADDNADDQPQGAYDPDFGFFLTNEGRFRAGDGSVSYYSRQRGTMANNIYAVANNGAALGDVVQSITLRGERAYIAVNNSNVVRIVNANTFVDQGSLPVTLPRYIYIPRDTAGYITLHNPAFDSLQGRVRVFNPNTNQVGRTLELTILPGRMLANGNEFWVLPEFGGRRLARISLTGHAVLGYISFANGIRGGAVDNTGRIWIANGAQLARLSANGTVEQRLTFSGNISNLTIGNAGTVLYFRLADGIYRAPTSLTATNQAQRILGARAGVYSMGWDPTTEQLLLGIAPNFTDPGRLVRHNSTTGAVVDSFTVGIIPGNFGFR